MEKETCENCKYGTEPSKKGKITCRRYPPQVVYDGMLHAKSRGPQLEITDWCGEWKKKDR